MNKKNKISLENELFLKFNDGKLRFSDILFFALIKSFSSDGLNTSVNNISKYIKISYNTGKSCSNRLFENRLISIDENGQQDIVGNLSGDYFEHIPKALIMSGNIPNNHKTFLIFSWGTFVCSEKKLSQSSLIKAMDNSTKLNYSWLNRVSNEMISMETLIEENGFIEINIPEISDEVISSLVSDNDYLENVVIEYESKTKIKRENIFDYDPKTMTPETIKKPEKPKWVQPVFDAIDEGCKKINKRKFKFSSEEIKTVCNYIKEMVAADDSDLNEVVKKVSDSIEWKAYMCGIDTKQKKFYTKDFFCRKTKNNIKSNMYFFDEYKKRVPEYGIKKKKIVQKKSEEHVSFQEAFGHSDEYDEKKDKVVEIKIDPLGAIND